MAEPRVCVYTAIFGGHAALTSPVDPGDEAYVCFSDQDHPAPGRWDVRRRPLAGNPRLCAKAYKMRRGEPLPDCDVSIWVDGSIKLTAAKDFVRACVASLGGNGIAFFKHPDRDNIYDEERVSEKLPWKYNAERMRRQIEGYRRAGLPDAHGLWAGGVIVRDHHMDWVRRLDEEWMRACEAGSLQDQLSLPYLLWKMGRAPGQIQGAGLVYGGPYHQWIWNAA